MSETKIGTAGKTDPASKPSGGSAAASTKLPDVADFAAKSDNPKPDTSKAANSAPANATNSEDHERNAVFTSLVTGDDDIVGLVAYSIYKQNKHDWLVSFNKAKGREPGEQETFSYIIGEGTQRRLAIYRHLAQATLDGRGPQVSGSPGAAKFPQRASTNSAASGSAQSGAGKKTLAFVLGAIVIGLALYFAAKYGLPGIQR